jgi:hypothetical protein
MVFIFQSLAGPFQATVQNNFFCFGLLESHDECFEIDFNNCTQFFQTIIEILQALDGNKVIKKCFEINIQKKHHYFREIFPGENLGETDFIKFTCQSTTQVILYELKISQKQQVQFLSSFRFFLINSLPIITPFKVWLRHCITLNLQQLRDSCIVLYRIAQDFVKEANIQCDTYELMELFYCHLNLITVYKKYLI